jgi:hypothetical protein
MYAMNSRIVWVRFMARRADLSELPLSPYRILPPNSVRQKRTRLTFTERKCRALAMLNHTQSSKKLLS